jgi:hypothetical protein
MPVYTPHQEYLSNQHLWQRERDAYAGEDAIKARCIQNSAPDSLTLAAQSYLPRLTGQNDAEYAAYLGRAAWYGATGRTVEGLVGAVFQSDADIQLTGDLEALEDNADRTGTPLQLFAKHLFREVLLLGRYGLLIDLPATGGETPYLCGYAAESILNWRIGMIDDTPILTRVVLKEKYAEPDPKDEWLDIPRTRYRVLELDEAGHYRVRVFRHTAQPDGTDKPNEVVQDEPIVPKRRGEPLSSIPFVFFGPTSLDASVARSPVLDLINVNLHHFRLSAELNHGLFVTSMPQPVVIGDVSRDPTKPGDRRIGTALAWELPLNADAKFLEFSGAGLGAIREELVGDEGRMVLLGARLLEPQKRAAEAAEALRLRQSGESATLASIADTVSWGITVALSFAAEWTGEKPDKNTATLSQEFADAIMSEDDANKVVDRWQKGGATQDDAFYLLKKGGRIAPGETAETWARKLQDQGPLAVSMPAADPAPPIAA